MPTVAVVVLNYNGRHFLEQFLPSIARTNYPNFHLYVADNGSTDDSVIYLKNDFPAVKLICLEKNYGFAEGYNQALKQVEADYYVLLNSDVEVPSNWLNPLINLMSSDEQIGACQPKIKLHENKTLFEHAGGSGGWMDSLGYPFCRGRILSKLEEDKGQYDDIQEIFWATGAALCIKGSLYHKIGGLDGDFFAHMEEIELCWRLKRAGYKVMVCPSSEVYHVGGGTLPPSNPRKTYLNFRNNMITLFKNERGGKLLWLIPLRLLLDGLAGLRFVLEGKLKDCWAIVKAHWYVWFHLIAIFSKRRQNNTLVESCRIGKDNKSGIYNGSIVWDFFVRKKQFFSAIIKP